MYRREDRAQPEFESFHLRFGGRLRSDNRWVRLGKLIPWDEIDARYAALFSTIGAPAIGARIAFGALVIKEKLGHTDRETVEQIRENPYLQYFLGYESYQEELPFDASMMVHFRKRLGVDVIGEINELIVEAAQVAPSGEPEEDEGSPRRPAPGVETDEPGETTERPENAGNLLMDASCVPADIRYPTDL